MLYNKVQLDIYRAQLEARMLRRAQPQAQPGDNRYCSLVRNYCMCAPTYALQICTKPRSLHHALYSKLCSAGCYLYRGFHGTGKLVGLYDDLWRTLAWESGRPWDEDPSSLQWSLVFFVKPCPDLCCVKPLEATLNYIPSSPHRGEEIKAGS